MRAAEFLCCVRALFDSHLCFQQKNDPPHRVSHFGGDPDENRTRVTAVKGRCLSRLTTGPYFGGGSWI